MGYLEKPNPGKVRGYNADDIVLKRENQIAWWSIRFTIKVHKIE